MFLFSNYSYFKSKIDYTFDGDTVSYMLEDKLYFNEKLSGCRREDDVVTTLNVALMVHIIYTVRTLILAIILFCMLLLKYILSICFNINKSLLAGIILVQCMLLEKKRLQKYESLCFKLRKTFIVLYGERRYMNFI